MGWVVIQIKANRLCLFYHSFDCSIVVFPHCLGHNLVMSTAFITHPDCLLHEMGSWHPESPSRLTAISDQLIANGLAGYLVDVEAKLAPRSAIEAVHPPSYVQAIEQSVPATGYVSLDADTQLNAHSFKAACRAAGAAVQAVDLVMSGAVDSAFCSVRPPGHHATVSQAMGFCVFNNVAIATRYAIDTYHLKRVAIIDFDVHHGNGTEDIFADDPHVLMCSFFQHPFYPYSGARPAGENMLNIPVPAGADGKVIRELVSTYWIDKLHQFKPELICISAGFDAHREDDMGQLKLVEADYAWMTQQIMQIAQQYAQGRIVSLLEGGYELSALARSVVAHLKVLSGLA